MSDHKKPGEKKRPARYKLYDRLNLKLKVVDAVIYALLALLVLALLWGVFVR